jgi:hypothetical protein
MVRRPLSPHRSSLQPPVRRLMESSPGKARLRGGAASLDYVLVLGVVFLLGGLSLVLSSKIMVLAYDMICALVSWPFL